MPKQLSKFKYARSPNLETIEMVEAFIGKNSERYNKTELWKKLPRGVMWQTYLVILNYLKRIEKIRIEESGRIKSLIRIEEKAEEKTEKEETNLVPFLPSYVG